MDVSFVMKKKLKKKETINYTLLFWGQNIFQRARICDRGKNRSHRITLNFTKLGLFMLYTVAIILALAR